MRNPECACRKITAKAECDRLHAKNEALMEALKMIAARANLRKGDDPVRECMHIHSQASAALAKAKEQS